MSFYTSKLFLVNLLLTTMSTFIWAATHDELPQCGITGVYKTRQSVIQSPNYPENYSPNTCWDYVIRSPFRCPTKFHIQFLDFHLESSVNCTNDYLAIGLENDGDDMDLLCGQVIGIKKYHTPDGVLRLRFFADDSPWTTAKGFKLLITRLACEREDLLRSNTDLTDEDTETVNSPPGHLEPPDNVLPAIFQNSSIQNQYMPFPFQSLFGLNYPNRFPVPPSPTGLGGFYLPVSLQQPLQPSNQVQQAEANKPCIRTQGGLTYLPQTYLHTNQGVVQPQQQSPHLFDQIGAAQVQSSPITPPPSPHISSIPITRQQLPLPFITNANDPCCASSFNQKRFYLSSPGFPRTAFTSILPTQQQDCQFQLEKSVQNVCRLRIEFKFFDFGQTYSSSGSKQGNIEVAIGTSKDVCTADFLEIDGERFCGCRTGYVHTTLWGLGKKLLRMRIGYSGVPSSGFLLDIHQEECSGLDATQNINLGGGPAQGFNNIGQPQNTFNPLGFNNVQQQFLNTPQQIGLVPQQQLYPLYQQNLPQQYLNQFWMQPQPQQQQQLPIGYPVPQFRSTRSLEFAKGETAHQPVSVVETNSTRKEYYYFDGDESFDRARISDEPDELDNVINTQFHASLRARCSFDAMNVLRLSMDYYWLTKPTCFSPQNRWLSNIFG